MKFAFQLWLLVFACGCSGTLNKVKRAPGFGIESLRQGGLMLAGVTALGGGEYAPGEAISRSFREALHEAEPDLRFVGLFEIRDLIGEERMALFMKQFSESGEIPVGLFAELRGDDMIPRYLAWVDITRDEPSRGDRQRRNVTYRWVTDGEGRSYQVVDRVDYVTTASAGRSVSAEFTVHELSSGREVWSARLSDGKTASESRRNTFYYPAAPRINAPGTFDVVEGILERAAKLLTH